MNCMVLVFISLALLNQDFAGGPAPRPARAFQSMVSRSQAAVQDFPANASLLECLILTFPGILPTLVQSLHGLQISFLELPSGFAVLLLAGL